MSMNRRRSLGLLFGTALVLGAGAEPAFAQVKEPLVFAAASLKNALDDVAGQWQRESGKKVTISYAASNTLNKEIEQDAPADMLSSADLGCMEYDQRNNLINVQTRAYLLRHWSVLGATDEAT